MSLATGDEYLQAVEDGDLVPPGLMPWLQWLAHRRGDAATTTPAAEYRMWKTVMAARHGPTWREDLQAQSCEAEYAGSQFAEQDLAELLGRGEYVAKLRGLCSDAQVSLLKELLSAVLHNDGISDAECSGRCKALKQLLNTRGHRLSVDQERMFSFALNSVLHAPERLATRESKVLTPKTPATRKPKEKASACDMRNLGDGLDGSGHPTLHGGGFGGCPAPHGGGCGGHPTPHGSGFGGLETPCDSSKEVCTHVSLAVGTEVFGALLMLPQHVVRSPTVFNRFAALASDDDDGDDDNDDEFESPDVLTALTALPVDVENIPDQAFVHTLESCVDSGSDSAPGSCGSVSADRVCGACSVSLAADAFVSAAIETCEDCCSFPQDELIGSIARYSAQGACTGRSSNEPNPVWRPSVCSAHLPTETVVCAFVAAARKVKRRKEVSLKTFVNGWLGHFAKVVCQTEQLDRLQLPRRRVRQFLCLNSRLRSLSQCMFVFVPASAVKATLPRQLMNIVIVVLASVVFA